MGLKRKSCRKISKNFGEQEQPRHTKQETPNKISTFKILTLYIERDIYEGDASSDNIKFIFG